MKKKVKLVKYDLNKHVWLFFLDLYINKWGNNRLNCTLELQFEVIKSRNQVDNVQKKEKHAR